MDKRRVVILFVIGIALCFIATLAGMRWENDERPYAQVLFRLPIAAYGVAGWELAREIVKGSSKP